MQNYVSVSGTNASLSMVYIIIVYNKLSYRRGTARCVVSVEILPTATQQCRNQPTCTTSPEQSISCRYNEFPFNTV